ncbi:MAG TPA: DUF86 domain-containing protein [Firmicutes bacterium]|nr:DUF86 domain-containing protein [Bacillota bacterium]
MTEMWIQQKLNNLGNAIVRLREALNEPPENPLLVDGTIQRFEFTFELFWKTFKALLEAEGMEIATPKEALRRAYQAGWISDEQAWLRMLRARNETSHVYNEAAARRIYEQIRQDFPAMEAAFGKIRSMVL